MTPHLTAKGYASNLSIDAEELHTDHLEPLCLIPRTFSRSHAGALPNYSERDGGKDKSPIPPRE